MAEELTVDQQKLLLHRLRQEIMALLHESPLTAKEVARTVNATVGNAHYHLQRLVSGGLLVAEDVPTAEGTVEKRYRVSGHRPLRATPTIPMEPGLLDIDQSLWLTVAETGQLVNELKAVLYRWQSAHGEPRGRAQPVALSVKLGRLPTS
ncbi:MAG: winged helix-turn-helix domain-containing protein [Firmicutes bacterium]|nr:winged helix-turn-helix domain-containing protein [Bacillota bacterium]